MPLTFVRVAVADNSVVPETTSPSESPEGSGDIEPSTVTALGAPAEPAIIPRVDWLNAEHPWNVTQITISHAIIHHTVHPNIPRTLREAKQHMRDIRTQHISQGKNDIGYNFAIDREGRIFQGIHNPWHSTTDVWGAHAYFSNRYSLSSRNL